MKTKRQKTIKASECSTIKMVAGNEKKFDTVIHDGIVKDWVGIGWVEVRSATKQDYKKYPVIVYESS